MQKFSYQKSIDFNLFEPLSASPFKCNAIPERMDVYDKTGLIYWPTFVRLVREEYLPWISIMMRQDAGRPSDSRVVSRRKQASVLYHFAEISEFHREMMSAQWFDNFS